MTSSDAVEGHQLVLKVRPTKVILHTAFHTFLSLFGSFIFHPLQLCATFSSPAFSAPYRFVLHFYVSHFHVVHFSVPVQSRRVGVWLSRRGWLKDEGADEQAHLVGCGVAGVEVAAELFDECSSTQHLFPDGVSTVPAAVNVLRMRVHQHDVVTARRQPPHQPEVVAHHVT